MAEPRNADEIEGLHPDEDATLGDYPIDTLLIRNETRTVHDVLRRMERGDYVMDPEFQRDFIWPLDKQSKLIESVLMRIPLPVFYLAENKAGKMVVVDGLQRLSTFRRFVNNELSLKLPNRTELNKKTFAELSARLQNRIEDTNLVLYVIDSRVPTQALLDIFERVNSGEPLTRQQMRNCLYSGAATRWLKAAAATEAFVQATGESLDAKRMRDREMINRFAAFRILPLESYKGEMDTFLAEALAALNNFSDAEWSVLKLEFDQVVQLNAGIFGKHAFRKFQSVEDSRSTFNASIWDVMTAGLARFPLDLVADNAGALRDAFVALLENEEFVAAVTYSTNQTSRVKARFFIATEMFKEVLGVDPN